MPTLVFDKVIRVNLSSSRRRRRNIVHMSKKLVGLSKKSQIWRRKPFKLECERSGRYNFKKIFKKV